MCNNWLLFKDLISILQKAQNSGVERCVSKRPRLWLENGFNPPPNEEEKTRPNSQSTESILNFRVARYIVYGIVYNVNFLLNSIGNIYNLQQIN